MNWQLFKRVHLISERVVDGGTIESMYKDYSPFYINRLHGWIWNEQSYRRCMPTIAKTKHQYLGKDSTHNVYAAGSAIYLATDIVK
jgi:hypothetical protein